MSIYQERFWSKVDASGDCWIWTGGGHGNGYGSVYAGPERWMVRTHRYAWELLVGPIPDGIELDHMCQVKRCVNPDHLRPLTRDEHAAVTVPANSRRQRCTWGHEFDEENTYLTPDGRRQCRACNRRRQAEYAERQKGAA